MVSRSTRIGKAGCTASRSIAKSLTRAARVINREWFSKFPDDAPVLWGNTCSECRMAWTEWTHSKKRMWVADGRREGMAYHSMASAVKSCNRLFDLSCSCDKDMFEDVRNDFVRSQVQSGSGYVHLPSLFSRDPVGLLERTVRRIIGRGWGKSIDRRIRVPNQRGCFDCPTKKGGTLGARPWLSQDKPCGEIRSVVAKTKGKARVVTLQNSYVKDILRPIHEGLYDSLSRHDWLIRGEVTAEHLNPLVDDLREGEEHISGDYSQATNLIEKKAVLCVVRVLCESDHLTPEEKRVLWESFDNLEHVSCHGRVKFNRGSMMGSYVSFPILCILNRAFYLITRQWLHRLRRERWEERPARFNGDDCAFNGEPIFFHLWKIVTSWYGMIVNEEKTGRSRDKIELNSRTYFVGPRRFAPKPVLSFLAATSDNLLLEALDQSKGLSFETRVWIINHLLLPWIRAGDVNPEALPLGIFRRLVKKAWFRKACDNERTTAEKTFEWDSEQSKFVRTEQRGIRMTVGPRPTEDNLEWFSEKYRDVQRQYLEDNRGKKVRIPNEKRWYFPFRKADIPQGPEKRLSLSESSWGFVWPVDLLRETLAREPDRLACEKDSPVWLTDHPFLVVKRNLIRTVTRKVFAPVLEGEWLREVIVDRWGEVSAPLYAHG